MKRLFCALMIFLLCFSLAALSAKIDVEYPFVIMDFNNKPYDISPFGEKCLADNLTKQYHTAACTALYIRDRDLHNKGNYLQLSYDVEPDNSRVGYIVDFKGLDLSLFEQFSFNIKGDLQAGFTDIVKIEISTWNQKIFYIIEDIKATWKQYTVSLDDFKGNLEDFNWEGVETIAFVFENVSIEKKRGKIFLDDMVLHPKRSTSISLDRLKLQKWLKPRSRLFKFPEDKKKKINLKQSHKKILSSIAQDTWNFFRYVIDKNTFLVMDNITVHKNLKSSKVGDYTNITNIGLQILCIIAASDLGYIEEEEALHMLQKILVTIKGVKKWNGLCYNYYLTKNAKIANQFISSVDNGWLASGLIVLRNSFDGKFRQEATELLNNMDFSKLYNPKMGQLYLGFNTDKDVPSKYHYGLLCTEPRITSLIGIGKGDIPKEHWFRIFRTLPTDWDWQRQKPKGKKKEIMGVEFFEGYYELKGVKFVPSWGGSMFETLMPLIVLDEEKWAPESLGLNDRNVTQLHIQYSLDRGFKFWGFSPCSVPDTMWGGYHEFGIPDLGAKGYLPEGIVTPHAIILALLAHDEEAVMKNLIGLIKAYPDVYGQFGLYDSVNIDDESVTKKYLALDQGMILLALCNYLNEGSLYRKFEKDEIFQNIKDLISVENFFE